VISDWWVVGGWVGASDEVATYNSLGEALGD
jgi:hypothetical protein